MKLSTLTVSLIAISSATAFAAAPTAGSRMLGLVETVATLEARYPGKVVAIELDDSGDKAAHYHVELRFPDSGSARLDVDAATLGIGLHETAPVESGAATLAQASALLTAAIPGEMLVAELDSTDDVPAHYDIDIRLPQGAVARLKVDAVTRQIGWRTPAIVND